ncbi:MAG TPA: iron ABC transporter permease [Bacteroidales bacterium]|nr:iron ABC transporter permease [Bacteroidales bacterium]
MQKSLKINKQIERGNIFASGKRHKLIFTGLFFLVISFLILDIFFGSVSIKASDVLKAIFADTGSNLETIVLKFRLPKAITALIVGIALSLSGLQMQTIFRNPMAGPYVLGISSGASLGVAFVILGFSANISPANLAGLGNWILIAASWAGAGIVMLLVMFISSRVKDIMTILILGIMLASGISAVVTIMQYFSNETMLKAYVIWTMGSLGNLTSSQLNVLLISVSVGVLLSLISVKMLNALLLGENYASSIGLNVRFSRVVIFACTSILAGSVTAFCGPIGFIGIAVPHIARILFRTSDHKILIPGTILTGGAVMLASDIISQLPGSESVLPVNAVTSLIGIPVVIWVILRNRKYSDLF